MPGDSFEEVQVAMGKQTMKQVLGGYDGSDAKNRYAYTVLFARM